MIGTKVRTPWITPHRFTPSTHSQSLTLCSQTSPPAATPALLNSRCTAPNASSVRCARRSTSAPRLTSTVSASTCAPCARNSSAVAASACGWMSASASLMPSPAAMRANSRPKPLPAPVTTATLPAKSFMSDQPHELLADVAPLQQPDEGLGRVLQPLRDRLAVLQLARGDQRAELAECLGPQLHALGDDEALDPQAVDQHRAEVLQRHRLPVVAGDQPADRDPAEGIHPAQHRVERLAANVVEVAVDAAGGRRPKVRVELPRLVVDAGVEAVLVDDDAALVRPARDAHHAAALAPGQLADDRAHGAAGRGHHDGLAFLRCNDPVQPVPRSDARHADRAE